MILTLVVIPPTYVIWRWRSEVKHTRELPEREAKPQEFALDQR